MRTSKNTRVIIYNTGSLALGKQEEGMVTIFLEPKVSALLVASYEARREELLEKHEDEEDIKEGLKALVEEKGTVTWEEYQLKRAEKRRQSALSG